MAKGCHIVLAMALLVGGVIHMDVLLAGAYMPGGDKNPKWTRTKDGKFDVIVDGATGRVAVFGEQPLGPLVVAVTLEGFNYLESSSVYVTADPPIVLHIRRYVSGVAETVIWIHKSDGTRLAIRGSDLVTGLRPQPIAFAGLMAGYPYWLQSLPAFGVGTVSFVTAEKALVTLDLLSGGLQKSFIADEDRRPGATPDAFKDSKVLGADLLRWNEAARKAAQEATSSVGEEIQEAGAKPEAFEDLATRVW